MAGWGQGTGFLCGDGNLGLQFPPQRRRNSYLESLGGIWCSEGTGERFAACQSSLTSNILDAGFLTSSRPGVRMWSLVWLPAHRVPAQCPGAPSPQNQLPALRCPHPSPLGLPEHLCPRALRLSRMALLRPLARFVDWPASLNGELKAKPSPQTPWNGVPKGARK